MTERNVMEDVENEHDVEEQGDDRHDGEHEEDQAKEADKRKDIRTCAAVVTSPKIPPSTALRSPSTTLTETHVLTLKASLQ